MFNSGRRAEGLAVIEQSIEMRANVDSVLALRFFYALFAENLAIHGNYRRAESINNKATALSRSGQKWGDIASYRTMAVLAAAENQPDWRHVAACME